MRIGHGYPAGVRAVLDDAEGHARRHGHPGVGCEHLLLAVAAADDPLGAALRRCGLTPQRIDRALAGVLARPRRVLFEGVDGPALAVLGIDLDAVRRNVQELLGAQTAHPRPETGLRVALRRRGAPRKGGGYPVTTRARACLRVAQTASGSGRWPPDPGPRLAVEVVGVPGGLVPPILAEIGLAADDLHAEILAIEGGFSS